MVVTGAPSKDQTNEVFSEVKGQEAIKEKDI